MNEMERQKRVIDMMITAHSVLRDRYRKLASIFEILLLVASIILNALIFVDAHFINKFTGLNQDQQKLIIGLSCLIVFIVSIVMLKVSWHERSNSHSVAAEQLFSLKQECREIMSLPDDMLSSIVISDFNHKYTQITNMLIKIPDNMFNSLKLIHTKKIELSKLIDKYPGSWLWILRIRLFFSSFKEKK